MMLDKAKIIAILKENKPFLEKKGVKRIGLYGSYARSQETLESDVDIFLEMEKNDYQKLLDILLFLEKRLGRKVDLTYKREGMRPSFLHTLEREMIYAE
jgi:uncharacterized protein